MQGRNFRGHNVIYPQNMALNGTIAPFWDPGIPIDQRLIRRSGWLALHETLTNIAVEKVVHKSYDIVA